MGYMGGSVCVRCAMQLLRQAGWHCAWRLKCVTNTVWRVTAGVLYFISTLLQAQHDVCLLCLCRDCFGLTGGLHLLLCMLATKRASASFSSVAGRASIAPPTKGCRPARHTRNALRVLGNMGLARSSRVC